MIALEESVHDLRYCRLSKEPLAIRAHWLTSAVKDLLGSTAELRFVGKNVNLGAVRLFRSGYPFRAELLVCPSPHHPTNNQVSLSVQTGILEQ